MCRKYLAIVAGFFLLLGAAMADKEEKQPVYVGARVCVRCHDGQGTGHQFSRWLLSKHAVAYAMLSTPEAKAMASLSGIPEEPLVSPVCLGCHATAADAEKWERDPTFRLEDGVQCEKCHGPGSEYASAGVMRNREAAMKAGLRLPPIKDCELCHYVKGSHVAIHKLPKLDMQEAWKRITHPRPDAAALPEPHPPAPAAATRPGANYVGVHACVQCHSGPAMGYQFSRWRTSAHARAYATLSTNRAAEYAEKAGVRGDPQRAPACLKCHVTGSDRGRGVRDTFSADEGVGCEACHGAGSEYAAEAVMRDRRSARAAGLAAVTSDTCAACHRDAHGKPFDYEKAKVTIAHPTRPAASPEARTIYKTPLNLAISPDGREIYVACEASGTVVVVDAARGEKTAEIEVGGQPADVTFSPDGRRAYVSNRLDDTVAVIDVATRRVTARIAVGDEPHGVLTDPSGKTLYVLNTSSNDISVVDTAALKEVKRLEASRGPWSLALSPDGARMVVTNMLSRFVPFRAPSVSEITVLDTGRAQVDERVPVAQANLMLGAAWHPSGEFALVTLNRTKNLLPMTRIQQGWTITNGLGVMWNDGRMDQVLLDEPNHYFPDATDVAITPDGRYALVTSSSTDRVAVVDVLKLTAMLKSASRYEREKVLPNHLAKSTEFVVKHLGVENSPRGIAIAPGGKSAYVANALNDSLTVIDLGAMTVAGRVDLGGPKVITKARYGERLFNNAGITFQRQFSCHSCHPDGHVDGLTYDIEADGIGVSPVDNRTLRGILDTDPFKWEGTNPTLSRQCGPRLAVFFTRLQPFTPEQLSALDYYVSTIPRPPNHHRPAGTDLTDAQRRGKAVFFRAVTNDGREIARDQRCSTCHFPPLFTDRSRRDVGSEYELDRQGSFDVPHLNNIYDSAPYLHNGMAATLEEIWTRFNPRDTHGITNDLTKDQLNDLIEYLKTL